MIPHGVTFRDWLPGFHGSRDGFTIEWERASGVPNHIGVSSGDGLSVDMVLKKGPVEGEDWLAVSVHVPLRMIAGPELPPQEPEYVVAPASPGRPLTATARPSRASRCAMAAPSPRDPAGHESDPSLCRTHGADHSILVPCSPPRG